MNDVNDLVLLAFLLLLCAVSYALGRSHRRRTSWEDGYHKAMERAASTMFRTAVRAAVLNSNNAARRFGLPPVGRARPQQPCPVDKRLEEETTIVLPFRGRDTSKTGAA